MKKVLLLLSFFTFCTTAFSQIPNYVPQNGLVGWWPFNGNANDESGNGNHGTVNGATLTADRFGNVNQAYGFDGNDNISITQSMSISSMNYSFSVWTNIFQAYQSNNAPQHYIICWGCTSSGGYLNIDQDMIQYCCGNFYTSTNLNEWGHYLVTKNNGQINLYKNGSLVSSGINLTLEINSNLNLVFGSTNIQTEFTIGKIDDIGIWNRALTECEIQDLYQAQLNSVSQSISAGADQSICAGDNVTLSGAGGSNYQWSNNVVDGQAFAPTQSNAYVLTAQDSLGCTGIDTVVVTVLENATSTLTETALDSYTLNGQTYTQSGTYTQTLTAANGCDSTITLNLTLNFTGIDELGTNAKKLVNITDLNGKTIPRRKNTLMLFIYEDGTVERVVEIEE
jgi:hypothetical protein